MKPGPVPKAAAARQRHAKPQVLNRPGGVGGSIEQVPDPPANLPRRVAGWWDALFASGLAPLIQPTDLPALGRLFELYGDRERAREQMRPPRRVPKPRRRKGEEHNEWQHRLATWRREQAMTQFVVWDDRGGVKPNPMLRIIADIDDRIVALEDRLALNPAARAKLGLAEMRAKSLAQLNAESTIATEPMDEPDPRASIRQLHLRGTRREKP